MDNLATIAMIKKCRRVLDESPDCRDRVYKEARLDRLESRLMADPAHRDSVIKTKKTKYTGRIKDFGKEIG